MPKPTVICCVSSYSLVLMVHPEKFIVKLILVCLHNLTVEKNMADCMWFVGGALLHCGQ